ncbi:hypothetical protein AB6A40_007046 [Gnathostoma spinigerum]|uniref:Large ribosomal subunit protein uL22m n=1 Tax=Gnathostoma spinigerum TaxID=75299 RepID=A0ABD6EMA0_9BILA
MSRAVCTAAKQFLSLPKPVLFRQSEYASSYGIARALERKGVYGRVKSNVSVYDTANISTEDAWKERLKLRKPHIQRFYKEKPKLFYAPEWKLDEKPNKEEGYPDPLKGYEMTPEKWEYQNKVVWPPNFLCPETKLPKLREVYHCKESIHFSPKRMWTACQLVWRLNVDEAIRQLKFQQTKACTILAAVLEEAKERAGKEFNVEYPSDMHVAEAFPIQCKIIKGARRHAHEVWNVIRYRYIHVFVRLEEGDGPGFRGREKPKDTWEMMDEYYRYLRSRRIKYSL